MFSDKNIDVFPNSGGFKRGFSVIIQYQKPTELPGDQKINKSIKLETF